MIFSHLSFRFRSFAKIALGFILTFSALGVRAQVVPLTWTSGDILSGPDGLGALLTIPTLSNLFTITVSSTNNHTFDGRAVVNQTTFNWTGGNLSGSSGATFTNASGGIINDSSTGTFGGTTTVTNATGANYNLSVTKTIPVAFTNDGTLTVSAGTLSLSGGGSSAGTIHAASGATVQFAASFAVPDLAKLTGTGTFALTGGTLTAGGTFGATTFNQTGGTLAGTHTFNAPVTWTAGTWNSTGTTTIAAGKTLSISGTADHDYNLRAIVVDGTVNWSQGRLRSGNGGSLTIASGGTFNDNTTATTAINNDYSGTGSTFINNGTFNKTGAVTTTIGQIFNNVGTLSVQAGTLKLDGVSTFAAGGPVAVSSGATLQFDANATVADAAVFSGPGAFSLTDGTLTLAGTFGASGGFSQSGGVLAGTHTFNAPATWTAGTWNSTGTTTIAAGKTLSISGTVDHDYNLRTIVNSGTIAWNAGRLRSGNGGGIVNQGAFNDTITTAYAINNDYSGTTSTFLNTTAGTYTKSGATTTTFNIPFTNQGAVSVTAGRLSFDNGGSTAAGSTLAVAAGASLRFNGGSFSIAGPSTLALTGGLEVANGTTTLAAGVYSFPSVDIGGGTLTGAGTVVATTFNQSGGSLSADSFALTGAGTWTGGNWNTATTRSASVLGTASLTISGTASHDFDFRSISNFGTINWQGGQLRSGHDGGITTTASSVFNDSASTFITPAFGGAMTFAHAGTYNKTATGTTTMQATFQSTGTVNVNAGRFSLTGGGSASAGSAINVASGASLEFGGGTFSLAAANNLAFAAGSSATVSGGTTTLASGGFSPPSLTMTNGTFNANDAAATSTIPAFTMSGGTFNAAGTLTTQTLTLTGGTLAPIAFTLTGNSTWSAGNWNTAAASTATIASGATLSLTTTSVHDFNFRTITNLGTLDWQAGQFRTGNGGGFINAGSGIVNDAASSFFTPAYGNGGSFANAGIYNKTASGTSSIQTTFANTGTVNVNAGRLSLDGGGSTSAGSAINVASGAALEFGGGTMALAAANNLTFAAGSAATVSGGTTTLASGGFSPPALAVTGGTFNATDAAATSTIPGLTVSGGTFSGAGALATAALTQSGGSIGFASLALTGNSSWTSGNWNSTAASTATIASGTTLTISTASVHDFDFRTITNHGTIAWQGGQLRSGHGGGLTNAASATMNDSAGSIFSPAYGGTATFSNFGTYQKTGAGTSTFQGAFVNQGTATVAGGKLRLDGGGNTVVGSTLNVAGGTTLEFGGGTFSFAAPSTLATTGNFNVVGGTVGFAGGNFTLPVLNVSAGTLDGAGSITTPAFNQTGGAIEVASLLLTGPAAWSTGNWNSATASTANIAAGATLTIATSNVHDFNRRTITNQGTLEWQSGQLRSGNGGGFVNSVGAVVNDAASNFFNAGYGGTANFTNAGTYNKLAAGTSNFQSGFINHGTANVTAGTLALSGGGSASASAVFTLAPGTALNFEGGTFTLSSGASINGTGSIALTAGTVEVTSGTVSVPNLAISGGTLDGAGTAAIPAFSQTGGSVGIAHLSLTGTAAWTAGNWNASAPATATIGSGVTLNLATANSHDFNFRTVTNQGTVNWSLGYLRSGFGGGFTNAAGAVFNDTNASGYSIYNPYGGSFVFANHGTYNRNAAGTTSYVDTKFDNHGVVNVLAGDLQFRGGGTMTSGGSIAAAAGTNVFFVDDYAIGNGASLTGAGTYWLSGGTTTVTGTINVSTFNQTGGTLAGNNTLNGTFNWSSGNWNAGAPGFTTIIASGATINLNTGGHKDLDYRAVVNNGTVVWNQGYIRGGHGSTFTNAGTFTDANASSYTVHVGYGGTFSFTNAGTYNRNVGGTTYFDVPFHNSGTVNLQQGDIQIRQGGTMAATGVVNASAGTNFYLTNDYTILDGARFAGAGNIMQTAGTLTLNGALKATAFNWAAGDWNATAGTASGATTSIDSGTVLNLVTGGNKDFDYRAIVNHGTVNWQLGYIRAGHGATFTNAAGGTFNDQNASGYTVHAAYGGAFSFTNAGTYNRNVGGTTYFDVPFHNSGTVNLQQGTMLIRQGGTMGASGIVNAAAGTHFSLTDDYQLLAGAQFAGAGTFSQTGGTLTFANLRASSFSWLGGDWNGVGNSAIDATTTLILASGSNKDLDQRTVVNHGTVQWHTGYIRGGNGATFTNAAGATFDDRNASGYSVHAAYGGAFAFVNRGTYLRNVGGTTYFDTTFDNHGTLNLLQGSIQIRQGGTMSATSIVNAAPGTQLLFTDDYTIATGSEFGGGGLIAQIGGTLTVDTLKAATFEWQSGDWNGAGTSTVAAGTVLALVTGGSKDFDARTIVNQGTVNWVSGYIRGGHGSSFVNAGTFNDLNASGYSMHNAYGGTIAFTNNGTYNKSSGGTSYIDVPFINNNGLVAVNAGTLRFVDAFTQSAGTLAVASGATAKFDHGLNFAAGILTGGGTIEGDVTNHGLLSPGTSLGALGISGNLTLVAGSAMHFELGGTTQGATYDFVSVSGAAQLGGDLRLSFANGFQSAVPAGQTFTLLTAASIANPLTFPFANVASGQRLFTLDNFGSFQVNYGAGSPFAANSLVLSNFVPVPEPSTYALLGSGLALVAWLRRRRRSSSSA